MKLKTELPFKKSKPIDFLKSYEAIELMIQEQIAGLSIFYHQINNINDIINKMYEHLIEHKNGRIIYCGAGTSGRIGVQDGAELYPTFGWPKKRFDFIIAGGKNALTNSIEGSEDNLKDAKKQISKVDIKHEDVLLGITASGSTPFTCYVTDIAKKSKALTISISNNKNSKISKISDLNLILITEEEVIAGSTRLKAGTTQKVALNIISSLLMTKFGLVKHGLMRNMRPLNKKLKERKKFIDKFYKSID